MPFNRPTLSDIRARVGADIERHSGQKATTRGDIYFPLAQAVAGVSHGLHAHLDYNLDQVFDKSADDENLQRRAAEMDIIRIPATRSVGTAQAKGQIGAVIESGTLVQDDQQRMFVVTAEHTLATETASIAIQAVEAGAAGNLAANTALSLMEPILGVESEWTVEQLSAGADIEPISRVRQRLDERRKQPPMGGCDHDYIAWAKAAHVDVTRAWVVPNGLGIGTILVRFVTDNLASPIPSQAHIDAVTAHIDSERPSGQKARQIIGPAPKALGFTFTRLTPDTPAVRAAINEELADLIRREGSPGCTLYLSQINEAISLATGERDHRIDLTDDFTCAPGEFPVLGVIS